MLDTLGTVFVFKSLANDEEISDRKRQNRMLKDLVRKRDKMARRVPRVSWWSSWMFANGESAEGAGFLFLYS